MDAAFRTPLLDLFRRGEAPSDVRMLAARGALAPRAHEQLALLVWLLEDDEEEIRRAAGATLDRIPTGVLAGFLARPDAGPELRAFFATRGIQPAGEPGERSDGEEPFVSDAPAAEAEAPAEPEALLQQLSAMSVAERMKVAMRGSREARNILIRDPNRLIAAAVLSSPKLTESEVEAFAKMGSVSEEVLRIIGNTRAWLRKYPIMAALAHNPKTPIAVSLTLLPHLTERDAKMISLDRNVAEPVRLAARKIVVTSASRRQ